MQDLVWVVRDWVPEESVLQERVQSVVRDWVPEESVLQERVQSAV